jgi:hypothetical protein
MQPDGRHSSHILVLRGNVRCFTCNAQVAICLMIRTRLVLRLGKPMEHLQAALRAALASGPPAEQILAIGRQLGYFGYLTYDTLVWV